MRFSNKKGAALMQVLLVTVILAGMATMLLRAMLSRSTASRRTVRTVSAQTLINSCMTEVNMFWSLKKPEVFRRDLSAGIMYCDKTGTAASCSPANKRYTYLCKETEFDGVKFQVLAYFPTKKTNCSSSQEPNCAKYAAFQSTTDDLTTFDNSNQIVYEVIKGSRYL